jgi:serine/threonine protein kinase
VLAKPLARGGMGALYLAVRDLPVGGGSDVCVIKTVLPHLADKEYLQRFRDEAKVVVQLDHQNLVPVFDSGEVGGEIYLGMDFVDGRDLRAVWNRCAKKGVAFPMDVAVYLVRELALGLEYAHGFGDIRLVHRDVSPPNVLVGFDGAVKLTDFGLASSTLKLEKTAPGIIYGKVSYMSPEQARGEILDGRTDLFAAGIILWELLTGRQLYPAKVAGAAAAANGREARAAEDGPEPPPSAEELLKRVRFPEIVAPSRRASRVTPELDRIALKALSPRLDERYQTCAELAADLSAYLRARAPSTDRARIGKFLGELYSEDLESDRVAREVDLAEARMLLGSLSSRIDRAPGSLTVPGIPLRKLAEDLDSGHAEHFDSGAPTGAERKHPSPARRSGQGTMAAGPIGQARRILNRKSPPDGGRASEGSAADPGGASAGVIGSLIGGRYRVRRLSGEGGMGRVYEAEHIEIGKRVALKILHPAYSQTPDLIERLRREARAASRIGHPNVVDVTDSGTTEDGAFFFVMEYLEGRELGDLVFEEHGLEVWRAVAIAQQICRALQAAHNAGVIHRDLKPENVLIVNRDGQKDFVKVLDFGIAKNLTDQDEEIRGNPRRKLTNPGVAMGTPEYMAPEQAAGSPADARSDIYAVGGILYEMLVGKSAFEGTNFMEVLHKKATETPAPIHAVRDDVPSELEALILRTMARDPGARPQTMAELEHALGELAFEFAPEVGRGRTSQPRDLPGPVVLAGAAGGPAAWDWLVADRRRLASLSAAAMVAVAVVGFGISRARQSSMRGAGLPTAALSMGAEATSPRTVGAAVATMPYAAVVVMPGAGTAAPLVVGMPGPGASPGLARSVAPFGPAGSPAVGSVLVESTTRSSPVEPVAALGVDRSATSLESPGEAAANPAAAPAPVAPRVRSTAAPGPTAAENRRSLEEAEQLLRAQRFTEARERFAKLSKVKGTRGRALVALAEIAFQEKNYEETIRSAKMAADRGGGARAKVLLGDAHFRLSHYQDAVSAYTQALRIDPENSSAKSGLALASKRM